MMTGLDIGMSGGWFIPLTLVGSAVAIVWFLVMRSQSDQDRAIADPRDILEERLARGEIDATEYEQARRVLNK